MADHSEGAGSAVESVMEKISEKIHAHDSSSSDSDDDKSVSQSSVKAKIYRAFGREKPVHHVLGGGKRMVTVSLLKITYLYEICYPIEYALFGLVFPFSYSFFNYLNQWRFDLRKQ